MRRRERWEGVLEARSPYCTIRTSGTIHHMLPGYTIGSLRQRCWKDAKFILFEVITGFGRAFR